jgi:hypothetical protein
MSDSTDAPDNIYFEYDDLTLPEQITNFILLGFYLTTFAAAYLQFRTQLKENRSIIIGNRILPVLILSSLLFR